MKERDYLEYVGVVKIILLNFTRKVRAHGLDLVDSEQASVALSCNTVLNLWTREKAGNFLSSERLLACEEWLR